MTVKEETCIAFHGYNPVIINLQCDELCGYACQSAQGENKGLSRYIFSQDKGWFSSEDEGGNDRFL